MIIPETLGKYRIIEFLGSGSFGTVYFAEDTILKKNVALKVQPYRAEKGKELIEEARILFELNHENIVRFFNVEIIEDKIVLVMEPVKGFTLREVIEKDAPMRYQDAFAIVKEILKALEYAHSKGLLHGDIKPENVLISAETGKVKLADFGLARIFKQKQEIARIAGTPFYMAPEVWKGESSRYSDIYSVGSILFELLTKKPPFQAESIEELRNKVFNSRVERIPGVSIEVNNLIKRALSRNPSARPSAGEFLVTINKILKAPELDIMSVQRVRKDPFFGNLTEEQIKFVEDPSRVILLRGVVGSGKTTALAYKLAYCIKKLQEDPQSFLFVTFTGKAVNVFNGILEKILDEDTARDVSSMTFHQLGNLIVRFGCERIGIADDFRVLTDREAEEILQRIVGNPHLARTVLREIKMAKSSLLSADKLESIEYSDWTREVALYYKKYQEELIKNNLLDYEDLVFYACILLEKYPDIRADFRARFKYLIVDEFQDVNKAIYQMILQFVNEESRLWASGDETQSIYRFRGASPEFFSNLTQRFPEASKHYLTVNFRTARKILDAGINLISHSREVPHITSLTTLLEDEGAISFSYHENETKEAQYVAAKIQELRDEGFDYTDIAVIYRTNEYSRQIEDALKKVEIPYTILEGGSFYDLPEIQAVLGIFRHLASIYSPENLEVIVRNFLKVPGNLAAKILKYYSTSGKILTTGITDTELLQDVQKFSEFLSGVAKRIKRISDDQEIITPDLVVGEFIRIADERRWVPQKTLENLSEFLLTLRETNLRDPRDVLNYVSLMREIGLASRRHHGVLLLTAHKAKGLEFPVVFVTGLIEGLFPLGRRSIRKDHLEEERRLLYVAITRAQLRVYLSYPLYYRNEKREPSRFILELTKRR